MSSRSITFWCFVQGSLCWHATYAAVNESDDARLWWRLLWQFSICWSTCYWIFKYWRITKTPTGNYKTLIKNIWTLKWEISNIVHWLNVTLISHLEGSLICDSFSHYVFYTYPDEITY